MGIFKSVSARGWGAFGQSGLLAVGVAVCIAGCGGPAAKPYSGEVYPVKGKVLLASGKPLTGGRVVFLPKEMGKGMAAAGEIGSDGTFSLKSLDDREGAGPGEYKVRIEPTAEMRKISAGSKVPVLPFPAIYAEEDGDTGLTATVKAEPTQLEPFKLTPPAQAAPASRLRVTD